MQRNINAKKMPVLYENVAVHFALAVGVAMVTVRQKRQGSKMDWSFGLTVTQVLVAIGVTLFASFVKGAVGFAMPMIMMSGLGSFLPAETALAALILPTIATNISQSLRQGRAAAMASVWRYRLMIAMILIFIALSAQLVLLIPQALFYALLGVPILLFAISQLAGWQLVIPVENRNRAEVITGVVAGLYGGVSGIWGPPVLVYLLSTGVAKQENMRIQGVVFLLGAIVLLVAHLQSGVFAGDRAALSALLVPVAMAGLYAGFWLQDRLDAARFRRWTLVVLALTALNLIRRAWVLLG